MRKIIRILSMAVAVCLVFSGCGGGASDSKGESSSYALAETMESSNELDQLGSYGDLKFKVNSMWEKTEKADVTYYYFPQNDFIMISVSDFSSIKLDQAYADTVFSSIGNSFEKKEMVGKEVEAIAGIESYTAVMKLEKDGRLYQSKIVIFNNGNKLYSITFLNDQDTYEINLVLFEKYLASVEIEKEVEYSSYDWESNYEIADYEKFNSPASENGLENTLISVQGTVKETDVIVVDALHTFVLSDGEGKEWAVSVPNLEIKFEKGQQLVCYGVYLGQSKKVRDLPIFMLLRVQTKDELINVEYENVPLYMSYESDSPSSTGQGSSTPESLESAVGTRMNPVPFAQSYSGEYRRYGKEDFGFTISINEILRGKEAEDLAVSKNRYNAGKVPEGKELVLYKVSFTLNKFPPNDSFLCSRIYFKCFSSSYNEENGFISIAGLEDLHAELYEGASTEGWLYTLVDKSDEKPLVRFDDNTWLALYK